MQAFVDRHRALIARHARAVAGAPGEKIAAEDIARELELELLQLGKGIDASAVHSPNAYLRSIATHALGRARRRRTLIEQLAAGDDLDALSTDLAALDADLPPPPAPPSSETKAARALVDRVKSALSPHDALIFALVYEDGGSLDDAADALAMTPEDVGPARDRILAAAAANGVTIPAPAESRGDTP